MIFKNLSLHGILLSTLRIMFITAQAYQAAPAAGSTITDMGALAMQQQFWDRNLREDVTLDEIWNRQRAVVNINNNKIEMTDQVLAQIPSAPPGTFKITIGMTGPLKKAFQEGTDETMLGNGEQLDLYHLSLYFNEIKKSVAYRGWGIEYEQLQATGLYKTINPKFQKAWAEYRGKRMRVASMLTIEDALTKAPHDSTLKQQFNSNIFIPNIAIDSMPTWDISDLTATAGTEDSLGFYPDKVFSGADTYVEGIAEKMLTASGTGSTPQAYMAVDNLDDLDLWLRTRIKMPPCRIGGRTGYIFVVPSYVAFYLSSAVRASTMGKLWMDSHTGLTAEEMAFPGMHGRYKSLWIVEDERGPTLTVSGSSGSYTLQPGFVNPGNNDDRNLNPWSGTSGSLNYVFDVGFVYGAQALSEWIIYDPKYSTESTEFGQLLEKGSYMLGGIQLTRFDVDTPTDTVTGSAKTLIQRSCAMVLMSRVSGSASIRSTT